MLNRLFRWLTTISVYQRLIIDDDSQISLNKAINRPYWSFLNIFRAIKNTIIMYFIPNELQHFDPLFDDDKLMIISYPVFENWKYRYYVAYNSLNIINKLSVYGINSSIFEGESWKFRSFKKATFRNSEPKLTNSITCPANEHFNKVNILKVGLNNKNLTKYSEMMDNVCKRVIDKYATQKFTVQDMIQEISLRCMINILYGIDPFDELVDQFIKTVNRYINNLLPMFLWRRCPHFDAHHRSIDEVINDLEEHSQSKGLLHNNPQYQNSKNVVFSGLLASSDTMRAFGSNFIAHLALNPELIKEPLEECIMRSMIKRPTATYINRDHKDDHVLKIGDKEFFIPKGTTSHYYIPATIRYLEHTNFNFSFEKYNHVKLFGYSRHVCLGQYFAIMLTKKIGKYLFDNYKIIYTGGDIPLESVAATTRSRQFEISLSNI